MTQSSSIQKLDKNFAPTEVAEGLHWYDIRNMEVQGRGWAITESYFDRLPIRAKGVVRQPVWDLSQHSAGLAARFVTDSTSISAKWTLRNAGLSMPHMPASGVSGLDLYAKCNGRWVWAGVGIPNGVTTTVNLASGLAPVKREFMLYLPLYNGVQSVSIGLPPEAKLTLAPRRIGKKGMGIVVYGTSIVQGGCASRAGMGYPEILSRALNCHAVNLGFSGNGPMEAEVIRFMTELNPAVFILDCLPNMDAQQVKERTEPAVDILRRDRPDTPIVLVENIIYQRTPLMKRGAGGHEEKNAVFRAAYTRLKKAGVKRLHYVPCAKLLGDDNLGTVDGVHPTDVGFLRMAQALEPVVRKAMAK